MTLHELREDAGWALDIDLLAPPGDARRRGSSSSTRRTTRPGCCPTGRPSTRLVAIAAEAGAHLLVDEVYRFLEFDEADRLPAGADALERGISLGRDVEVVRDGRPAHRLAGDPRPRPAGALRRLQGLHDDLLVGAVGDPRAHRAACPRRRSSPARAASWPRTSSASTRSSMPGPTASRWVRPARRLDRLPAADRARASRSTTGRPGSSRPRASCSCRARSSGSAGNHFRLGFGRTDLPGGPRAPGVATRPRPCAEPRRAGWRLATALRGAARRP